MSILKPDELPLELIEKIIDEAFYAQHSPRADTLDRSERMMVDSQALSSLASVSHIFRQCVNAHRFAIISFHKSDWSGAITFRSIHAFLDLLRSDVWVTPSMGIVRHVRKLVLMLGERRPWGGWPVPHHATEDGSLATIMNAVFRGGEYPPGDYTLALIGGERQRLSWETINPDFVSTIESLLDSHIATLELTRLEAVPLMLMRRQHVKTLSISDTSLRVTPQYISDFRALGSWNHLENLEIYDVRFFDIVNREDIPMLRTLTVTVLNNSMASVISHNGRHWNMLEDLTLNLDNDHIMPEFCVDYRNFAHLTRLTIGLLVRQRTPLPNCAAHQILNLLGPHLPPLARLEIRIDIDVHSSSQTYSNLALLIFAQINCAALDTVLGLYPPSAVSTLVFQFRLKLSQDACVEDDMALEMFRQDGLAVVREAFPRLNAGPRRRVATTLKHWVEAYLEMFAIAYIASSE